MIDPLKKKLIPIEDLQEIRGVQLPARLNFVQLVVTGPPGAGKTYYINKVHGWPNEGYVDLTRKGWWKDQTLTYRPREVHLGFPFKGFDEALTVFDKEWLEAEEPLFLELERIQIPPSTTSVFQPNWITKYIFEFLLPDPKKIYKRRMARHSEGYFPVDKNLSLEMVTRQSDIYREVALYMDQAGMQVYVREGISNVPMRIAEKDDVNVPPWAGANSDFKPDLSTLSGWKWFVFRKEPHNWFTVSDEKQEVTSECRIAHDGKTFEMLIGDQHFVFRPEIPKGVKKKNIKKNWVIANSRDCNRDDIYAFARIKVGETVLIGRANEQYDEIFHFSKDISKRHLTITNKKGDLVLKPQDVTTPIFIIRSGDQDIRERLSTNRFNAVTAIRDIYGGEIALLPDSEAIDTIRKVNAIVSKESYREKLASGEPGALLQIPDDQSLVIIGDLHANIDNLLKVLTENCLIAHLTAGTATLVVLGDAVHSEVTGEMDKMDSSVLMMDLLFKLKCEFPKNFFYLLGNHDSFDSEISKGGFSQGVLMRKCLKELRGDEYVKEMQKFFDLLPLIMTSRTCVACHAAPPRKALSHEYIVALREHPKTVKEILTNRLKRSHYLAGYDKKDVKRFRSSLDLPKKATLVVGHTPLDPFNSFWKNAGNIKGHHIIYSGHLDGPSLFMQVRGKMIPLTYPAEPLLKIINEMS